MKYISWSWMAAAASLVAADTTEYVDNKHIDITRTTSPKSIITSPPVFHADLFKRAIATCGYIRGNSASPLTCPDGYNCATTAHALPVFACCNSIECINDWGVCQDYGQTDCQPQGIKLPASVCSSIYGSILSCSKENPHCFRYARSSVRGAYQTFYSYGCGTTTSDILVLETSTNGNQETAPEPTSAGSVPFVSIPGFTPSLFASPSTSPSSATINKSGLSRRRIVLIALLSAGALLIAIIVIYFFIWRRRQQNKTTMYPPPPYQPPYQSPYPPPMLNGPPPGPNYPWNNMQPVVLPMNMMPVKPPASPYPGPGMQEMSAPVRPLHEMPVSNDTSASGAGQNSYR
ncbi:hypothetical protein BKA66DRAFT_588825 [Pyrenochaeta sp. MPI-SDFR-AT-0127]|nr:hypothetical protein BKA66DRAFT_588825 [Pyrenochaeta sp. MPI-SDFR-AT-0127]